MPARPMRRARAYQQDLWHYTIAKMVDACAAAGIKAFYGPFGDFADGAACEAQFRNAFLMGCAGAWTLHPSQVPIAKRVFSPDPAEVAFAKKIIAAMPDGSGAVMIDGKMQDDATWKQAKVLVDLAGLGRRKRPRNGSAIRTMNGRSGKSWRQRSQSLLGKAAPQSWLVLSARHRRVS